MTESFDPSTFKKKFTYKLSLIWGPNQLTWIQNVETGNEAKAPAINKTKEFMFSGINMFGPDSQSF